MEDMKGKQIAVVVGGPSTEAEVSRRTGAAIAEALKKKGYAVETIELVPHTLAATLKEKKIDVVFNALHGRYGEDGVLQGLCEMMGIPYTGPGVMASAVGMNKVMSKAAFKGAGIATAPFAYYFANQDRKEIIADIENSFLCPSSSSRPARARASERSSSPPGKNWNRPLKKPLSTAHRS